jgi:hypothetical protein
MAQAAMQSRNDGSELRPKLSKGLKQGANLNSAALSGRRRRSGGIAPSLHLQ